MVLKEKIKMARYDKDNKKHNFTIIVSGRTQEELQGRIEKTIFKQSLTGAFLR